MCYLLEELEKSRGDGDIGQGDTLANKESALAKDLVQDSEDTGDILLGLLVGSLVEGNDTQGGVDPDARRGVDLMQCHTNIRKAGL